MPNRPSWCRNARSSASCSAPLAPASANQRRRSICRATNETSGIARGPGAGLDQLGQLLRLPAEELPVLHRERQPQHQLVEEQHDRVVAQALGVRGDRGQPGVQVDVGGLLGVRAEVVLDQRGHQQLALLRRPARRPGPPRRTRPSRCRCAEQPRPRVAAAAAGRAAVQPGEETLVPVAGPQPLGVGEDARRTRAARAAAPRDAAGRSAGCSPRNSACSSDSAPIR